MSDQWTPTSEKDRYGIVIHNFFQDAANRLRLTLGESVHVLEENGDWYFGVSTKNRAVRGIFPKSYVRIMESFTDRSGPTEVITLKQPQIVQEITSVLREWGAIWKHLYITNSKHFKVIEMKLYDLIRYRSKIITGTLPVDELKQMKRLVSSQIDVGNKLLGLDMVVRDEQGNILDPTRSSTMKLYWYHQLQTERIKKATSEPMDSDEKSSGGSGSGTSASQQYCHILFVAVRRFVCKVIGEDIELLMALYDGREAKPFTENYVVRWSKHNLMADPERLYNLKVLFTDLGTRDLNREKIYLVCYMVRCGGMDKSNGTRTMNSDLVRRPFGVAAMDITLYVNGKLEPDEDKQHFLPFLPCDKDNLDGTLKRILTLKELTPKDHKGQGLYASFKMLHGDIKQVREENPHMILGQVSVARKMGFPEVILPGDVRNDLYLTLVSGEFSKGSKSTDKNVQVSVTVCSETGETLQGVIKAGGGVEEESEYRSVVYYHEDKPRWAETCKVAVPIDDFKASHLKFTFKHRSSNDAKDKNEKPFALSFVRLMQENGTTLPDTQHELLVYKVDHKKYTPEDVGYLSLPATRNELEDGIKPSTNCLSLSSKDSFVIQTNVCSTKLTQNVDLLGLLNWTSQPIDQLSDSLTALMKVSGEEIVKFLQDVLDALFNILMQNSDCDLYDDKVFECLLYIIGLVLDLKYQHFQPVLDLYIQESFSATLAYNKLIVVFKGYIDNAGDPAIRELLLKAMKSLQYCIRFIVRSRILFADLYEGKVNDEFIFLFEEMLQSIVTLMHNNTDNTLLVQAACLKYLPSTIPDILQVFSATKLSQLLAELINNVPSQRLTKQKMMTLNDIVHSPLFLKPECREILLPIVLRHIKDLLEARDEPQRLESRMVDQHAKTKEFRNKTKSVAKVAKVLGESEVKLPDFQDNNQQVELCVKILSDIMDLLFYDNAGSTVLDLTEIMLTILRTVIQATIAMDRESPLIGNLVAVMLSILRQMRLHHFDSYLNHFATSTDLLDFLIEILLVFRDLVSRQVYQPDWCEMIMLQNSVILKSLRSFSHKIQDMSFEYQAWNNFFHCAIAFLTQPALQLETFSNDKRWRIISRYKDMRRETSFEIRRMWFSLGQHKINFIPSLVGPFLEMTLIPETELRRATIPIFFDMMQCEFYAARDGHSDRRDSNNIRGHFTEFENEMIAKLDNLVEGGKGDEHYKDLFLEILMNNCENHSTMREQGVKFVKTVTRLMERLLEYRCIINDDNKENRMSCTVNLLDFYSEINRKEMYIRYVNKLCDLHLECDNFTEAAYTLKLHAKLLSWMDTPLQGMLRNSKYPHCHTHRQLKEALYFDILQYFDLGKMWECAIEVCKELVKQFEESDLQQLSTLLRKMAQFYDNIMLKLRPEPEYFRVAYYGKGFPAFLQNKVFVYRGKEYERLSDFCSRTLNQLPNAELMNTLTPPSDEIKESPHQYVQINKVEPVMEEKRHRNCGRPVSEQILKYYRVNNVQKFRFSRPYHRKDSTTDSYNEFASLWVERNVLITSYPLPGILRWFPVLSSHTAHLSPLLNAIETMQLTNKSLRELIIQYQNDPHLPLSLLSLKLNGIVDAAVNGGINNYEKAFFTPEYEEKHKEEATEIAQLKELIAKQIPLLEVGIKIHGELAPASLVPFQQRLEHCFKEMQIHVESNYGVKTCDIKFEPVPLRRQTSAPVNDTNRLSGTSFGSNDGGGGTRSRVSSLTRSQVASLKTFVNFATMSPSSTLSRASSVHLRTPSRSSSIMSTTGPGSGGGCNEGGTSTRKEKKKKRRNTNRESTETERTTSQWYTMTPDEIMPSTMFFELNQQNLFQLTPTRPLRSEVEKEKRLSRPPSGQFPTKLLLTPTTNGNRDSIGTTDSTASEEDGIPPPLPAKLRSEADYCNLPDGNGEATPHLRHSTPPLTRLRSKPVPPEPIIDSPLPPLSPPPKPAQFKPPPIS